MELHLEFKTDKFKLSGPLPEHVNAGNQFYGEDLARWLCEVLPQWNLDCLDEDWGWLVFSTRQHQPADERHSIAIHGYPPESQESSDWGSWMLVVESSQRVKWLGLISYWKRCPYNERLVADVVNALESLGVHALTKTDED